MRDESELVWLEDDETGYRYLFNRKTGKCEEIRGREPEISNEKEA